MKQKTSTLAFLCIGMMLNGPIFIDAHAADIAKLIAPCEDCHGKDGASKESNIPIIGGFSALYATDSMIAYKNNERPCEDVKYPAGAHKGKTDNMCKSVENLSEDDMNLIAMHYADKPFVRAVQTFDADLAAHGKSLHALHCKKCHEDGGSSPDDDAGILAGQWMPYLQEQMDQYASGKRPIPEKMKPKTEKLNEDDIRALINYYGSIK